MDIALPNCAGSPGRREIPATRISVGCRVTTVATARRLAVEIARHGTLRGTVVDRGLDVWPADSATHNAYERAFGAGGLRLTLRAGAVEVTASDFDGHGRSGIRGTVRTDPVLRRLLPDIDAMDVIVNEI